MQTYLVKQVSRHNDLLSSEISVQPTDQPYHLGTVAPEKKVDCIIASAHDSNAWTYKKTASKLVSVISYVPDINDGNTWANFYTNICLADAVACSRLVYSALQTYAFPEKRWINLDGCTLDGTTVYNHRASAISTLRVYSLDENNLFWNKYCAYLRTHRKDVEIVAAPSFNVVAIGFFPVCPVLGAFMGRRCRHVTTGTHDDSQSFYDCRQIHNLNNTHVKIMAMTGSAVSKPITEAFSEFTEELESLVKHLDKNAPQTFTSNVSIFDRIFHQINRTI